MPNAASPSTVGMIVRRSPRQFATDPFYVELIGGLEEVLSERGRHVLLRAAHDMPAELAEYRRWAASGSVCAVVMVDIVPDDMRPALLEELGLPTVIVGEPDPSVTLPSVRADNYGAMRDAVAHLLSSGHRRIARVTGLTSLVHTQERTRGFLDALGEAGLEPLIEEGDYSPESAVAATRALLAADNPPTAILYDNDVMAIAGLESAQAAGVSVPEQLSLVAWDDSQLCQLCDPPLSVLSHDVHARGVLAAHSLLAVLDGTDPGHVFAEPSVFVERGSSAVAPDAEANSDPV